MPTSARGCKDGASVHAAMRTVRQQVITALWWTIIIHSSAHWHHLSCWAPPSTQPAPHQGHLHPSTHTHTQRKHTPPVSQSPGLQRDPCRITPALSLYILHHCLLFLPYAVFSPLLRCSLTVWVLDRSCRLPCITLMYQEAKPYFMLQPHLLPCISPAELMNAGSDACLPMVVDSKKKRKSLERSGASNLKGRRESIAVIEVDTGSDVS